MRELQKNNSEFGHIFGCFLFNCYKLEDMLNHADTVLEKLHTYRRNKAVKSQPSRWRRSSKVEYGVKMQQSTILKVLNYSRLSFSRHGRGSPTDHLMHIAHRNGMSFQSETQLHNFQESVCTARLTKSFV